MSRSVRMPGPAPSGSMTTAAPTLRSAISAAALRSVWPGPIVSTTSLIPSRTCIRPNSLSQSSRGPAKDATRPLWQSGCAPSPGCLSMHIILLRGSRVDSPMPTQRPATVRLRTSLFQDAGAIVEDEYGSELALDDIARRVASSRRQLQRAYAEIGNTTFREHLTGVRMEKAALLLRQRDLTVREVARRVGYRQPAQFAKAFR